MIQQLFRSSFNLHPSLLFPSVPWSSGDDFWFTSRQRWFESIRDHSKNSKGFNDVSFSSPLSSQGK